MRLARPQSDRLRRKEVDLGFTSTVNCWPSADAGTVTVNLEYELENTALSLHNVVISIPLPPGAEPAISEPPAHGTYSINPHTGHLDWAIDEVSEAAGTGSGSLEFECEGDDTDALFPVSVNFVSQRGMCGVEVSLGPGPEVLVTNSLQTKGADIAFLLIGCRRRQPRDGLVRRRLLARLAARRRPLRGGVVGSVLTGGRSVLPNVERRGEVSRAGRRACA